MHFDQRSLYDVLGVAPDAPIEVIRAAYRVQARLHHPDSADSRRDPEKMAAVNEAFETLSDPVRRASYDTELARRARSGREEAANQAAAAAHAREQAERGRATWAAHAAEEERRSRARAQAEAQAAAAARAAAFAEALKRQREIRAERFDRLRRFLKHHRLALAVAGTVLVLAIGSGFAVSARMANEREARVLEARAVEARAVSAAQASAAAVQAAKAAEDAKAAEAARVAEAAKVAEEAKAAEAARVAAEKCQSGARGTRRNLEGCDLSRTDLGGLNLSDRILTSANLAGANLKGAILDRAKLAGVVWSGATCPDGTSASEHGETCAKSLLKLGDKARPLAIGRSVRIADWRVTVRSLKANADSNRIAVDNYNLKPGTGYVYAIARIDATWLGPGQGMVSELDFEINGVTSISDGASCTVVDLDTQEILNTGQSTSFRECIYLKKSKARRGVLAVYAGYSFEGAPAAYWAIR